MRSYVSPVIEAGFAERKITPAADGNGVVAKSIPMAEEDWAGMCRLVRDDIYVRAIAFREGNHTALIIVCDLIVLLRDFVEKMRERICRKTGVPADKIMLAATQNHSAPRTYWEDGVTRPEEDLAEWFEMLEGEMVESASEAVGSLEPVSIGFGEGKAEGIAANRRPVGKNGKVVMSWNRPRTEDIADGGVEDPMVGVVRVDTVDGRTKAVLFHFSCHPNVLWANRAISADFPGRACSIIKSALGSEVVPVFLNGFCGDIDPFKYMRVPREAYCAPDVFEPGSGVEMCLAESDRLGDVLGREVVEVAKIIEVSDSMAFLTTESVFVRGNLRKGKICYDQGQSFELQAIAIGETWAMVGFPGEPFMEIGRAIKSASPFPVTFPLGQANGYCGYLPTSDAYEKGGYGVGEGVANFLAGTDKVLIESSVRLLSSLKKRVRRP